MSIREQNKRYEFVKLCSSLTKQGLRFTKGESFTLMFDFYYFKRLMNPFTKTPFVNSTSYKKIGKNKIQVYPNQWSDRKQ